MGAALPQSSVRQLSLAENALGDAGMQALASVLRNTPILTLKLSESWLSNESMEKLAAGIRAAPLTSLDLSYSSIHSEGIKALARALGESNIELLNLLGVDVEEEAGRALLEGARDTAVIKLRLSGCSDKTLSGIQEVLTANQARAFLLQMQVEGDETSWTFTFRTAAGTLAAVLDWSSDRPVQELRSEVFTAMTASTGDFQLPDRHLRAHNLRIVRPDGLLLEDGRAAVSLAQQLGDQKKRRRR